jgi:hypothetical protein
MLYGYRGQMIDWDYTAGIYKLNTRDEAVFTEEVSWRYNDFHRQYNPYIRLIGAAAMQLYIKSAASTQRLDCYMLQMARDGGFIDRDVILPTYRPLESLTVTVPLSCDIGRIDAPAQLLTIFRTISTRPDETHFPVDATKSSEQQHQPFIYSRHCSSPTDVVSDFPDPASNNNEPSCENRKITRSRVQQTGV